MINLKKKKAFASGGNGSYFKITQRTGVKIIRAQGFHSLRNVKSIVKKNQNIIREATIGLLAKGLTKDIEIVKMGNQYFLGIVMNHFEQTTTFDLSLKDIERIKAKLKKKNVLHSDLHEGNILFKTKSNYKIIDFDPAYSTYVGDKRKYYTVKNKLIKSVLEKFQNET